MIRWSLVSLVAVVVGCAGQAEVKERGDALLEQARTLGLSECVDAYLACTEPLQICIDELSSCIDGSSASGSGSSSCGAARSINGDSQSMDCTDGECTCTENGVEVGTCEDDSCAIPGGCCDAFFDDDDTTTTNTDSGTTTTTTDSGTTTTPVDTGTTDTGTGGTSGTIVNCSGATSVNGDTLQVDCSSNTCTCLENGVDVGQCAQNAQNCAIPGSCCDAFF
ncbi:MAG: hypothetical protein KTR31_22045 [Myxococcales bacterium]|nr:hypothetical protein [Myxococcales bacterium]